MVTLVDLQTRSATKRVPVGASPYEVAIAPGGRAYVTNLLDDNVSILENGEATGTIQTGEQPSMAALSEDGKWVYTGNGGSGDVSVLDAATGKEARRFPAGSRTHGVALAAGKLYVTNTGDDRLSVIDPVSGRTLATVEVGRSPNGIAVKPPAAGS